ncbi:uncharacterized protein LOC108740873 isoform X2 [Agrilus planipennis]|uniref:Uncharacterized protein LOC108740873 isoform X2 n=1 Tax=Agrilus planipennis TaxID=224129 RepID=A0A1W4X439_AGRPL|nr:uncharacterized protein LOC108740873 isoform X2 [Agrilus planipennis]
MSFFISNNVGLHLLISSNSSELSYLIRVFLIDECGIELLKYLFVINLLFTNLLSSVFLIPLLLIDQKLDNGERTSSMVHHDFGFSNNGTGTLIIQDKEEELIVDADFLKDVEEDEGVVSIATTITATNQSETDSDIVTTDSLSEQNERNASDIRNQSWRTVLCYLAQSSTSLVCTASILSILLIAIDQYFAVIHSLRYHSYINKFRSGILIASSWLVSAIFAVLGALTGNESNIWRFCISHQTQSTLNHDTKTELKIINSLYAFSYCIFVIVVPFLAICMIYICIYTAAHQNSERMRRSTSGTASILDSYMQITHNNKVPSDTGLNMRRNSHEKEKPVVEQTLPKVRSAPNFTVFQEQDDHLMKKQELVPTLVVTHAKVTRTSSERHNFISSLKYKISNASLFKYREETRAAKISVLVVFMVFVCYIPYGISIVLNSSVINVRSPRTYNYLCLILLILSNIISPFLFAYRNKRIQRELKKFFKISKPKTKIDILKDTLKRSSLKRSSILSFRQNRNNLDDICEDNENKTFLQGGGVVPEVVVTCKIESEKNERRSILKRVCSGQNWTGCKKCTFITLPESCLGTESARGSFSSTSTQMSSEE